MTTQREVHGIRFIYCPECNIGIGVRGLARHREKIHGVAPATTGSTRKPKALTTAAASMLRKAIKMGTITAADVLTAVPADGLIRAGFLTANTDGSWTVTSAGVARLAGK